MPLNKPHSWDRIVKEPRERKVFEALADERWDFRTVEGISHAVGIPESEVEEILKKYDDLVRLSPVRYEKNRMIYTLKSRPKNIQETLSAWRSYITKNTSTSS